MYEILKTHHCNREGLSAPGVRTAAADAKLAFTTPMGAIGTPGFLLRARRSPLTRTAADLSPVGARWAERKAFGKSTLRRERDDWTARLRWDAPSTRGCHGQKWRFDALDPRSDGMN